MESVIWSPGCRADLASVMAASAKTDSGCTGVGLAWRGARVPARFPPSTSLFTLPLVMGAFAFLSQTEKAHCPSEGFYCCDETL